MNSILGLGARLSKLRAMSPGEVVERLRYRAVLAGERAQHRRQRLAPPGRLRESLNASLQKSGWQGRLIASRQANRTRFLPGVHDRDAMRRLFDSTYDRERRDTLAHAASARRHHFEFFGRAFDYGDTIPWQADPVSGCAWPSGFHADVPIHQGDIGCGDVKHVWELSRQQYLIDLGKAYFLAGNAENVTAIRRLVRSWIAGNPYATGVNWACALEPAFRTFSWMWAYYLTIDALDDEFHLEWLCGFYDHGRFLARHLERHSSPYNHLIGEAAALYMLGACFPEFRASVKWRALGRAVLEEHLSEQFYRDGGPVEQSTFYHHATTGFYLLAALIGRATGDDLSGDVWRAIERSLDFSLALMQPDGSTPEIGGADDGKPIRMEHRRFWDFRPYQAMGAVLFGRADFKAAAGRFFEDALWLLGPAGAVRFDAIEETTPSARAFALDASGYYVARSDWSPRADYICFDCGEQAAGMRTDAVPNSMHGHADCLSLILWLDGRRVLVDSGFYAYNCGGVWEAHFRETAAHNTARVDGCDQARHIGKMAWSHSYRATAESWMADGAQTWVIGSHDGYARGPHGIRHRRAVWLRPGNYTLVYDEFDGSGKHDLEVNYQFAPGRLEQPHEQGVLYDGRVEAVWIGNPAWRAQIRTGGPSPEDGWIAPSLGVRQSAPRLSLRSQFAQPKASILTLFAARQGTAPRVSLVSSAAVLRVMGPDYIDWIAAPRLTSGGVLQTDALVGVCRVRDGLPIETANMGGTYVQADAERLAELGATIATAGGR